MSTRKVILQYKHEGRIYTLWVSVAHVLENVFKDSKGKRWYKGRFEVVRLVPIGSTSNEYV